MHRHGEEIKMSKLKLIDIIDGYTDEQGSSGARFISYDLSGSFAGKKTSRFWHAVSRFTGVLKALISYTSVRCYSLFLLGFGLVSLIIHFLKDYFGVAEQNPLSIVIVGAITALLGIFTVFSDKPLSIFLQFHKTDPKPNHRDMPWTNSPYIWPV